MNNYIILNKRKYLKHVQVIMQILALKKSFKNRRTTIWESNDIQISIDKSIIRILIFSKNDIAHYRNLFLEGLKK